MKEYFDHLKITLPLIGFCLPLFVKYSVEAENSCPYKNYMHIERKCLDISQAGLKNLSQELNNTSFEGVSRDIEKLDAKLTQLCLQEQPLDLAQSEIIEEMCQY